MRPDPALRGPDRFWAKVSVQPDGCWHWIGSLTSNRYGHIKYSGYYALAHRLAYEFARGEIPEGLVLDHLCRNTVCVNPDHLEAVTQQVNVRRGTGFAAVHAAKTHCPQGHEYTDENTSRDSKNRRYCRACVRQRQRDAYVPRKRVSSWQATKTHCPQGHPYDETNTYTSKSGRRSCRTCNRAAARAYKERKAVSS